MNIELIVYSWVTVGVFISVYIALWFAIHKKRKLTWLDWIFPIVPLGVWFSILAAGFGNQSLSNIGIEAPLILLTTLCGYILHVLLLYLFKNNRLTIERMLIVVIMIALMVTFFTPFYPE